MKYFFASDIHGSSFYTKKIIEKYKESNASKLVLLGDLLYHGPRNDLPKDYCPKEVFAMLNIKMISSQSEETVIRKLTRWSWIFQCNLTTV